MARPADDIRSHTFAEGFFFAARGFAHAVKTELHMKIHICFAIAAIILGIIFGIDAASWLAIVICIGVVFALETLNTAIEAACDSVTHERNEHIRIAKDAAAGAVLVMAVASLVVAAIIFLPRFAAALGF